MQLYKPARDREQPGKPSHPPPAGEARTWFIRYADGSEPDQRTGGVPRGPGEHAESADTLRHAEGTQDELQDLEMARR
jgi:hypothetical protein